MSHQFADYPDSLTNPTTVRVVRRSGAETVARFTTPRAARYFIDAMRDLSGIAAVEFVNPPPLELSEHETPVGQQQHVQ